MVKSLVVLVRGGFQEEVSPCVLAPHPWPSCMSCVFEEPWPGILLVLSLPPTMLNSYCVRLGKRFQKHGLLATS